MKRHEAKLYRAQMVEGAKNLSDTDALQVPMLYPRWRPGEEYTTGDRLYYDGKLWRALTDHVSQVSWSPGVSPSLFAEVLIPTPEIIPDWVQPESTNPYMTGDKVRHNNKVWISTADNNVWEPGVYGWDEVTE
ncbi:MAG: hypothetical protein K6B40_05295 [Firmicutes bacterium]|nr:hypothetical protein [Bacillota bacterium]